MTTQQRDPIHEEAGEWYFWHETWADRSGPFETRAGAQRALDWYAANYLRERGTPPPDPTPEIEWTFSDPRPQLVGREAVLQLEALLDKANEAVGFLWVAPRGLKLSEELAAVLTPVQALVTRLDLARMRANMEPGAPTSFYGAVHRAYNATAGDPCEGDEDGAHVCQAIAEAVRVELNAAGIHLSSDVEWRQREIAEMMGRDPDHERRIEAGDVPLGSFPTTLRTNTPEPPEGWGPWAERSFGPDEPRYETEHEAAEEPNFADEPCSVCEYVGDPDGHAEWYRQRRDRQRAEEIWRRGSLRMPPNAAQAVMSTITGGHDEQTIETQRWECENKNCFFFSRGGPHWHHRARRQDSYDTWSPWSDAQPYVPIDPKVPLDEAAFRDRIARYEQPPDDAFDDTIAGQEASLAAAARSLWDDMKRVGEHVWTVLTGKAF